MAFVIKTRDQILRDMVANFVANDDEVNDFSEGSTTRNMLEAVASAIEELYTSVHLGFRRAQIEIPENVFGVSKKEGTRATAELTFTKEITSLADIVTIPAGSRVSNSTGLIFITTEALTIAANVMTGTVAANSESVGRKFNLASGTLTSLEDALAGIESVTNAVATGGEDQETDLDYNYRFNRYIDGLGRCNPAGLEFAALEVSGITDAKAVDLIPPVNNVNCNLYVDNGTATSVTDAKITEVKEKIDGEGTDANPGWRSSGVNVAVLKPTIQLTDFTITMIIGREFDITSMETVVERRVAQYVNRLRIGVSLRTEQILAVIVLIPGVEKVTLNAPAADITVVDSEVARAQSFSFTTTKSS